MTLETLPDHRDSIVVVGTTVRKNQNVLAAHLDSIAAQELPPRTRLVPIYVPDFTASQADAYQHLMKWVNERGGQLLRSPHPPNESDFAEGPGLDSHQWTPSSMARVGANKNLILGEALKIRADYVWFVDADLILDRTTLASLLAAEKPITTAVFWTRWTKRGTETMQIHSAPQVWLNHPYQLEGRGLDASEFRAKLVNRELTRVWGYGACTLIRTDVIARGVHYGYLPDVPLEGLMAGEDRHFCIRAERLHIDAYADSWPDIFHIYHAEDEQRIPEWSSRLAAPHPTRASIGDLVSLRLRPLEPVPVGPGRVQQLSPQLVRGRLGALDLAPELEEAALGIERGEKVVVRVHFPSHHPNPFLRGRIRLIELTLIDAKPTGFPPNLEEELYAGLQSGRPLDHTTLTKMQHESLSEAANG